MTPQNGTQRLAGNASRGRMCGFSMVFSCFWRFLLFRLRTSQDGSKGLPDRSKAAPEAHKKAPRWPKETQDGPKTVLQGPQGRFRGPQTASEAPKTAPVSPRKLRAGLGEPQESSKTAQESPKMGYERPEIIQKGSQRLQRGSQDEEGPNRVLDWQSAGGLEVSENGEDGEQVRLRRRAMMSRKEGDGERRNGRGRGPSGRRGPAESVGNPKLFPCVL